MRNSFTNNAFIPIPRCTLSLARIPCESLLSRTFKKSLCRSGLKSSRGGARIPSRGIHTAAKHNMHPAESNFSSLAIEEQSSLSAPAHALAKLFDSPVAARRGRKKGEFLVFFFFYLLLSRVLIIAAVSERNGSGRRE